MSADFNACWAWSEESSVRTASSFAGRGWTGSAASLFRSLRDTTCCLSWARPGVPAKPGRAAIASIDTHTLTQKCILPPIFGWGKPSLRIASCCGKELLGNVLEEQSWQDACHLGGSGFSYLVASTDCHSPLIMPARICAALFPLRDCS